MTKITKNDYNCAPLFVHFCGCIFKRAPLLPIPDKNYLNRGKWLRNKLLNFIGVNCHVNQPTELSKELVYCISVIDPIVHVRDNTNKSRGIKHAGCRSRTRSVYNSFVILLGLGGKHTAACSTHPIRIHVKYIKFK